MELGRTRYQKRPRPRSNFLSEPPLNFQQIKFNDRRPLSPWNAGHVSAVVTGKLDLNRGDFAPHLSTSFRRWLRTNDRRRASITVSFLWVEHPYAVLLPFYASLLDTKKLIRLQRKPGSLIYARLFLPSLLRRLTCDYCSD